MRPIRLTMTAFGPYAGTEVVEFTAALDAGIFGIYGETGAGKTTIFDGISFALFGQSSGAERSAEDMVCHHAHATDITKVELVFDLGDERYVVQRVPKQQRAALRGSGTTTEPHQAYLFRSTGMPLAEIAGDNLGDIVAEKQVNRVDPEIEALLGYNAAQFRQIVLLPQGDFRKILTAPSDERSPILKRLFDVQLYERFADRIKRDAADIYRQINDERVRRDTHLGDLSEEQLADEIRSMGEEVSALETTVKAETETLVQCQKALSAGEGLAEKFEARGAAETEKATLESASEAVEETKSRLAKARAAQTVLVAESAMRAAGEEAGAAQTRHATAKVSLSSAQSALSVAQEALNRTEQQKDNRDAAHARVLELQRFEQTLGQSHTLLADLEAARSKTKAAVAEQATAERNRTNAEQSLTTLRNLQKEHPAHVRALQEVGNVLAAVEHEAEALGRFETAKSRRDLQAGEVDRLQTEYERRSTHLEVCKNALERAEQDLTEIQALHVARKLLPGEPCPACGSLDHPNPATGDPERRGRHDQFEQASREFRSAERDEIEAKTALAAARASLTERQTELDALDRPERDRKSFDPVLAEARDRRIALEADARFVDLESKIAMAETAAGETTSHHERARQDVSEARDAETRAQTSYDTLLRDVPENWRQGGALASALSAAVSARGELVAAHETATNGEKAAAVALSAAEQGVTSAVAEVDRTAQAFTKAQAEFTERLGTAGLDEAGFKVAKADVAQSDALEEQINSFNERVAANKAQLARLANEISNRSPPDVEALTAAKESAQTKLETSQQTHIRLQRDLEAKFETQRKVAALSIRIAALEAEYGPVGGLADLVNGNNERKVRLPDFAIAAMFDEVLVAANQRLGPMTGGRYQLLRPEDAVGGRQKRGLDIAVFDANTEKSRPTKTLSGGEGFQASLALALGLSDVVQQNSGGIKLDAIFIDEGFGTLDEDTLNTALETLYELTNDKRSVGLISHTEQVKSMITDGFDIEVTPSGSHIHTRRSAA
ncbi:exonuclease SbcC (plasmid) [Roseobacter denitrificans]|uniref:Exonuclease SbcC, putative n=2 Tax=Roseobacter denitrificans TaxID=2434 RepID=Q07GQ2_ROSDO|nr:AAA family ATPase [Roseobacter denitrificans]ABI93347.1 exonuclease SbcC, putative [Roseobacter denitrificans OCh 114]AVL51189.1 exonuclease SbcC [Roseobacter denitrificans]SFG41101.1 exonuclease SbcC [Roseobacter denitrificans OCh 114]